MKIDNFFKDCKTIEEGKSLYKTLMKEHHPDKGGDVEIAKKINNDYEDFITWVMEMAFDNDERSEGKDKTPFVDILNKIKEFNIRIEIIGFWIFAFDSYSVKDELKKLGFWFSKSRKAWVFSNTKKRGRGNYTTQQLRDMWGYEKIQNEKELKQVG